MSFEKDQAITTRGGRRGTVHEFRPPDRVVVKWDSDGEFRYVYSAQDLCALLQPVALGPNDD